MELFRLFMSLRFEVLETLESYQRASLLKVRDLHAGQEVYLRRYHAEHEELQSQSDLLAALKALDHPNIERFLELGSDDEGLFAIVDAPSGKSLGGVLREGPLSEMEFEQVARQVLGALAALHERGIPNISLRPEVIRVHRPATGLLDVRVGGFGEGFGRTTESEPAQAAAYRCTAPEQWRGDAVGRRTDVYAAGCIFYESLAGKPPFRPASINSLRAAHLSHDFVPLAKEAPQVKAWISAWVVKLLDPDMNTRPKDAGAALKLFNLREHLLPPEHGQGQTSLPPGYGPAAGSYPYATAIPVATAVAGDSGMVPLTRAVAPVPASSTTAFQPVMLAHKTAAVLPRSSRAVPHVPLTPTPRVSPKMKLLLIAGAAAVLVIAITSLMMMPSKPVMAPLAERLAMRLPVTSGLLMHLDASRHDTIDTNITNRTRRWNDDGDKTRFAAPPAVENGPAVIPAALHGLPVLDFNPYHSDHWVEFKSGSGAVLKLTTIRTVFWVMRGSGFLLSDDLTTDFHRGGDEGSPTARVFGGLVPDAVKNGVLRLNGAAVKTLDAVLPKDFSLVSLVTTGNASASRLCKDRLGNEGRTGGQEIAEVAIYDRPLNEAEIKQVETYLRTKWLAP
ncbi:MAG: serine/threonine protein kinase [Verrucomicrobiaceae bacterium]|nr:serine/threonine protein kinase [Verrucomicrobiaceae bacterium]